MSGSVDVIAIITPAPGKADRVEELLSKTAEYVKGNEPGTLRYHCQRETKGDAPTFVMLESYKDMGSVGVHGKSDAVKALGKAFKAENLLGAPMKVMITKSVGGFSSRL